MFAVRGVVSVSRRLRPCGGHSGVGAARGTTRQACHLSSPCSCARPAGVSSRNTTIHFVYDHDRRRCQGPLRSLRTRRRITRSCQIRLTQPSPSSARCRFESRWWRPASQPGASTLLVLQMRYGHRRDRAGQRHRDNVAGRLVAARRLFLDFRNRSVYCVPPVPLRHLRVSPNVCRCCYVC